MNFSYDIDWAKAFYKILSSIITNMATESTLADRILSVNARLQVSK